MLVLFYMNEHFFQCCDKKPNLNLSHISKRKSPGAMTIHLREIGAEGFNLDGHLSVARMSDLPAINITENSFWLGDDTLVTLTDGRVRFRRRKKNVLPPSIQQAGQEKGHASAQVTTDAAVAHAGVSDINAMKLSHWYAYMRTLKGDYSPSFRDIFNYGDQDFEETSEVHSDSIHANSFHGNLVGNSDTATVLSTPVKINGIDFDGSSDITFAIGVDGITSSNGNFGFNTADPKTNIHFFGSNKVTDGTPGSSDENVLRLSNGNADATVLFGLDDTATYISSFSKQDFAIGRNLALNATGGGNVGIGTSTPTVTLQVEGSTAQSGIYSQRLWVTGIGDNSGVGSPDDNTGSPWYGLGYDDLAWNVQVQRYPGKIPILSGYSGVALRSGAGNLVLTTAGDVGVGTAAPTEKLHIKDGNIRLDDTGTVSIQNKHDSSDYGTLELSSGYRGGSSRPKISIVGYTGAATVNGDNVIHFHTNGSQRMIVNQSGNVGIGTSTPSGKLHINGGRVCYTHTTPTFNGLLDPSEDGGRAQLVMTSAYTDLVLASSRVNDVHGSTISFTAVDPDNSSDYRKFVIGQGNWGARKHKLYFGYEDANHPNPHLCYGDHDAFRHNNVMTLDGMTKNVEVLGAFTANNSLNVANSTMHIVNGDGDHLCFKYVNEALNQGYSWGRWAGPHHYDVYSRPGYHQAPLYFNYYSHNAVHTSATHTSSDDRIKTNERYITDATKTLLKLKPQIYTKGPNIGSESDFSKTESGLIAQDLYYDAPELRHLVTYHDDAEIPDEKPHVDDDPTKDPDYSMWGSKSAGVDYIGLIAYLVQAFKENEQDKAALRERVTELESTIQTLKDSLNNLNNVTKTEKPE